MQLNRYGPTPRRSRRSAAATLATAGVAAALALAGAPGALADVGVTHVSRSTASAGDRISITLECGFCYPPCVGRFGHRHPAGYPRGTCMLDSGRQPPRGFPISLLPAARTPARRADEPPHGPPYLPLGAATPPPGGNDPASGDLPRYTLRFRLPAAHPARYAFVIYCAACRRGAGGSLIPSGALLVRAGGESPTARARALLSEGWWRRPG